MKPAKCHPERPMQARGLCNSCYSKWRYHNVKGAKETHIARVARYVGRVGRRRGEPFIMDMPPVKEGYKHYVFNITKAEGRSLDACLRRRGLVLPMGGRVWRKAA